jgi:hypothetical protein
VCHPMPGRLPMPLRRQYGHRRERRVRADLAARAFGECYLGSFPLARSGLATELSDQLDHLRKPGGADRVSPAQKPSPRIVRGAKPRCS